MELVTESDIYMPSIDENGNYIDKIPSFNTLKHGIKCSCGSRKDKTYESYSIFSSHIKTKIHRTWIHNLNLNKVNYYIENENLKKTVQNQKMIIANYEKKIQNNMMTINYLTQQLCSNNKTVENLLYFD